jgi:hypothetical protein
MSKARNLANLLADGAVGADELASTLDLSGKTLTLPEGVGGGGGSSITAGDSSVAVTDAGTDGTIAFNTDGAEAMRITSDGRLGIGTTSPNYPLNVQGSGDTFVGITGGTSNVAALLLGDADNKSLGRVSYNNSDNSLQFWADGSERARITSGGNFLVGNADGTALITAGSNKRITGNEAAGFTAGTSGYWAAGNTSGGSCTMGADFISSAGTAILAGDSGTTNGIYFRTYDSGYEYRFRIAVSGSATNSTGSYGTISDARTKTVVGDASLQWNDIKQLNFVKYKLNKNIEFEQSEENKGGYVAPKMLGLVAQEVEQICPGLIEESADPEFGQVKVIKTSILYMKAVKALQEAMERIETLESKVAALEAQ